MTNLVGKTVNLSSVGLEGDVKILISNFAKQAKKEGWKQEEIDKVITECESGDYDHLIDTLLAHSNVDEFEPEEEEEEEEENNEFMGAY